MKDKSIPRLARLTALRYFHEVVQHGSFRKAAIEINIAASAINRQITILEAHIDAKLFERGRGPSGLRLTDAGHILHYRLGAAMRELSAATEEIAELKGLERGHLRVGINDVFASGVFPEIIASIHGRHPNLTFQIVVDNSLELARRVVDGELDLVLGYNLPMLSDLRVLTEHRRRMHLVIPADHKMAQRRSIEIAAIDGMDFIMPDRSLGLRRLLDDAFFAAGISVNVVMQTNSVMLLHEMVGAGLGVSAVTDTFVGRAEANVHFIEIDTDDREFGVLSCCASARRILPAASLVLAEAVAARFSMPV